MPAKHYIVLGYAWVPLVAAFTWFGVLVALLSIWTAKGKPRIKADNGTVPYISDIGAIEKPLFIACCSVTTGFFVAALSLERWLRHKARLDPNQRSREKWLSILAILFAAAGGACLISLSVKDSINHNRLHWHFTIGFIVCIALSAIFTTAEWGWLNTDYKSARMLKFSYTLKLIIILLAIVFAIVLGVYFNNEQKQSTAAVMEWLVAFVFDLYLWTLVYDLYPAIHTKRVTHWNGPVAKERSGAGFHSPDSSVAGQV
ncbi:Frag1/DRAM/Sfk1 [Protomyces lactucae-debilis]|uniref:Frag1/DRAM/Sfk1 n=1 Tax=Protomyces lactucae-debilis TaxID=2754530 RepID=A0A1Y2FUB8_PROLT|nr:Frag1/DRAM/Sfk1 [Protomyces lactucae-debilis]ORY87578.1 Frag1/DRAM/Sfk1 [Protomyces lactucae-debilis]